MTKKADLDFIQSVIDNKPVQAAKNFEVAMAERLRPMLDDKKSEVINTVFNQPKED